MATDGDVNCKDYSLSQVKTSLAYIDRSRFPKNYSLLSQRLHEIEEHITATLHGSETQFDVRDSIECAREAGLADLRGRWAPRKGLSPIYGVPVTIAALGYAAYVYQSAVPVVLLVVMLLSGVQQAIFRPIIAKKRVELTPIRKISVSSQGIALRNTNLEGWDKFRIVEEHDNFFLFGRGVVWDWFPKSQIPLEVVQMLREAIEDRDAQQSV